MSEVFAFTVGFLLSSMFWLHIINNTETHVAIVQHGAAHWQVDAYGTTTFVWNNEEQK